MRIFSHQFVLRLQYIRMEQLRYLDLLSTLSLARLTSNIFLLMNNDAHSRYISHYSGLEGYPVKTKYCSIYLQICLTSDVSETFAVFRSEMCLSAVVYSAWYGMGEGEKHEWVSGCLDNGVDEWVVKYVPTYLYERLQHWMNHKSESVIADCLVVVWHPQDSNARNNLLLTAALYR